MNDDPDRFPDVAIDPGGVASERFLARGISELPEAIRFVRNLPYGRTGDRADYRSVLEEGVGTCSTKHALLARLCAEQGVDGVELTLGIYEMNDRNTPGTGDVLSAYGLDSLPEAHCYLAYDGTRFDFTRAEDGAEPIDRFLHEEPIRPDQIGAYKADRHRSYLAAWLEGSALDLGVDDLWRIREECIEHLSRTDA